MKKRFGFVTNSSSSSFIVRNLTTDEAFTNEDIARMMETTFERVRKEWYIPSDATFEQFIIDSNTVGPFCLGTGEETIIECGDHYDDGLFEQVVHSEDYCGNDKFSISFYQSHH